ncbi:MAG: hypothetical protein JW797_01025 [Bradymonadales bacterium]|nr:hypothetical protein [Bradymonadales bacterium]
MSQSSTMQRVYGTWHADLARWSQVDPQAAGKTFGFLFKLLAANLKVVFTEETLTIEGYGKGPARTDRYRLLSEDGSSAKIEVRRGARIGIYVVELLDDTHINLRLVEPKQDVLVLKRASTVRT